MNPGELKILTVGDGDTTLSFDPKKPEEVKRAKKVVEDMLRRGFALFVQVGTRKGEPLYQRAKAFDPKTAEYIIAGAPPDDDDEEAEKAAEEKSWKIRGKTGQKKKAAHRVPASGARAVAVARSAGG